MLVIENQQIEKFLLALKEKFNVFDCREDPISFKKYFLPPIQEMFLKNKDKIKTVKPPKKFVLFALNSTDISALTHLDEIMSQSREDFFYFQNRKQAIVIGVINKNFMTPSGGDLIFQKIDEENYKVWVKAKKGVALIKKYKIFFEEKNDDEKNSSLNSGDYKKTAVFEIPKSRVEEISSNSEWQKEMQNLLLDAEALKDAVVWSRENKIWDELAEICLGCGICSYVCPLCYCFSLEDKVELNGNCSRCRKWTSCVLPEFSKISGGHNFRPNLKERYYNWFYHKFARGYLEYGKSECVGCERCKIYCPAKIDILKVLKKILEEYKK